MNLTKIHCDGILNLLTVKSELANGISGILQIVRYESAWEDGDPLSDRY